MRGSTLIETVFAFTLLALVVLFVMSLAPSSLLTLARSHHQIQAATTAQSILEEQRGKPLDMLLPDPSMATYTLEDGLVLKPSMTVSAVPGTDKAKTVRVTVEWKERSGNRSVFREVLMARVNR